MPNGLDWRSSAEFRRLDPSQYAYPDPSNAIARGTGFMPIVGPPPPAVVTAPAPTSPNKGPTMEANPTRRTFQNTTVQWPFPQTPTYPTNPTYPTGGGPQIIPTQFGNTLTNWTNTLPGQGEPGSLLCGLAGLPSDCTYADIANKAASTLTGGGPGTSGGSPVVPGNFGNCPEGTLPSPTGCMPFSSGDPGKTMTPKTTNGAAPGKATLGWYGAGVSPTTTTRTVRKCPSGWVLGDDGICYRHLSRGKRMWDPGARPLLTGGEMSAIRKAARAAKRLDRTRKSIKKAGRALEKAC